MGSIYAAAQLTIIDAVGVDPHQGLWGISMYRRQTAEAAGRVQLVPLPQRWVTDRDIRDSAWASRAWTFQEGFFSKRRLVFTRRQAVFICNTETNCEACNIAPDGESEVSLNG